MTAGGWTDRALAAWVDGARRAAGPIVVAALVGTALLVLYTVENIRINTDTTDMLSRELPFRQADIAYRQAFPHVSDNLVVLVESANPDLAEDAAARLAAALRDRTDMFDSVFYPPGDPYFRDNGLLFLDVGELAGLSDRLAEAEPLLAALAADPSLRGLFGVLGEAVDDIRSGGAEPAGLATPFAAIAAVVEGRAAGDPRTLSWTELLRGPRPEPADRRRTIVAQPKLDPASLRPAAAAMAEVRNLGAELAIDAAHGLRLRLTGAAALDTEELQSVMQSAGRSAIGSLVLVAVLVVVGLRSPRLIASVMATLIAGLIWTAAFAAGAIGQLNLISVTFTVLFIGLGIDFGIHFGLRYREAVDEGVDQAEALRRTAVGVGPSLTISAVAAALAFYSFFPTAYRGLSELGLIAGTGMFIALFANLTLLPALLSVLPLRRSARPLPPILGPAVARFIDARRRPICVAALALGLAALPLLVELRFDFNPINLKDPNTESMQALRDLTQAGGAARATISVLATDIEAAAAQAARLAQLDRVDKTVTLDDFVPRDQDAKLAVIEQTAFFLGPLLLDVAVEAPPDDGERRAAVDSFRGKLAALLVPGHAGPAAAAMRRLAAALDALSSASAAGGDTLRGLEGDLVGTLPGRIESLRRAFNAGPVTFADLPDDLRRRYLAPDGRARIEVYPAEDIDDIEAQRRFVAAVRSLAPDAAGSPVVLLEAGNAVVRAFRQASTAALVLITVLMLLLLRSLWDVALVLVPVALSAALTTAASVLVGLPFNFANIIVLPLLLGLGVASGIQLVMRVREPGARLLDTSTPRAVLFSALTTVGSLGTLALSGHRGIAGMGQLLTIAIACTLLGALIVLPAMLALRARPGRGRPAP